MLAQMKNSNSLNQFCVQLNEFCLMFQEEILQLASSPPRQPDTRLALSFLESLILCPTADAARACIRRDVGGARSFLVVADAVLKRIRSQRFQLSIDEPQYQTKFYLLTCAINDYLKNRQEDAVGGTETICAKAKTNVSSSI